uniref:Uncharacterized protein n=1 Tax=Marinomonas sp. (strain MWYL1) TaxID=400668 RepID=A6W0P3_MARMS
MKTNEDLTLALCWQVKNAYQNRNYKAYIVVKYLLLHIAPTLFVISYAWLKPSFLKDEVIFFLVSGSYLLLAVGAVYLYYHYAGGNFCYNVRYELKNARICQTSWLTPLSRKVKLAFRCYQFLFIIFIFGAFFTTIILGRSQPSHFLFLLMLIPYAAILINTFDPGRIEKEQEKVVEINHTERFWLNPSYNELSVKLLNRKLNKQMIITFKDKRTQAEFNCLIKEQYRQVKTIESALMRRFI